MSAVTLEREHLLYRLFDHDGALLYVGITSDHVARFANHARTKPWWADVASFSVEVHTTGDAVAAAEASAIESECPRYNVRRGGPVDVRVFREPGIGKPPMVMRSIRVPLKLWTAARDVCDQREENISDVVREALERYVAAGRVVHELEENK